MFFSVLRYWTPPTTNMAGRKITILNRRYIFKWLDFFHCHVRFPGCTVDGRNPKQPPVIYENLWTMGYSPYQLVSQIPSINSIIKGRGSKYLPRSRKKIICWSLKYHPESHGAARTRRAPTIHLEMELFIPLEMTLWMGNWGYNLYKWSYFTLLITGRGPTL